MTITTILLADRLGGELSPLDQYDCPALLEVAGRMVIEYSLEDLSAAGIRRVLLVSAHPAALERRIGDGSRWGMKLDYLLSRGEQSPAEILSHTGYEFPLLMMRGDVIRGRTVSAFLDVASKSDLNCIAATWHGRDAGIAYVRKEWTHGSAWPSYDLGIATIEIGDAGFHPLDSIADFHAANVSASSGALNEFSPPGRRSGSSLVKARLACVDDGTPISGSLYAGIASRLRPNVRTKGPVIIGSRTMVDDGSYLENTVVMPDSYVGKNVDLRNAVVAGGHVIRVDSNTVLEIVDDFLISPLKSVTKGAKLDSWWDRVAGVFILLASLVLWPFAALLALVRNPKKPMVRRILLSNQSRRGEPVYFAAMHWNVPVPVLRYLPMLVPVIVGHLRLIGVRPSAPAASFTPLVAVPAGLIGPAQLDVSSEATEEEIELGETVFESRDGAIARLGYVLKAFTTLMSRRAWLPTPAAD